MDDNDLRLVITKGYEISENEEETPFLEFGPYGSLSEGDNFIDASNMNRILRKESDHDVIVKEFEEENFEMDEPKALKYL